MTGDLSADPYRPGKIGVTIKVPESKRYAGDNPWFVFEGTDATTVRNKIGDVFGIEVENLTLSAVVIEAQRLATGLGAVAHGLGGRVLDDGKASAPAASSEAPAASGGSVFQQAQAGQTAAPKADEDPILTAIEGAKTVEELKQIWAENQEAFADAKYMDPWKAKGKALS